MYIDTYGINLVNKQNTHDSLIKENLSELQKLYSLNGEKKKTTPEQVTPVLNKFKNKNSTAKQTLVVRSLDLGRCPC